MTRTEELIARSQSGDVEAGEALVKENAGLIWSVARRFLGRGTEADDLYQLGCLGFLKAVEGFDLEFGNFQHMLYQKLQGRYAGSFVMTELLKFPAVSKSVLQPSKSQVTCL